MIMPKLTVASYPEMLRKLSTAAFFVTIICLWVLRTHVLSIDALLKGLDVTTPDIPVFSVVKIPFGTFLIAFVVAMLSEAVKLHDKISDLFSIRLEFDLRWILMPMALLCGASLTTTQFERLKSERQRLIGTVFYEYASSTAGKQVIDGHAITQALTAWSWFWLCVEASAIVLISAAIFAYEGQFLWTAVFLTVAMVLRLVMRIFWADCSKYAYSQVQQILHNNDRKASVAMAFNAL